MNSQIVERKEPKEGRVMYKPLKEVDLKPGIQKIYRFSNNYGASVIQSATSYGSDCGLWELAVLKFEGKRPHIDYDTGITDDIIGWLTLNEVEDLLIKIEGL